MRRYPQVMVNVPVRTATELDDADAVWEAVAGRRGRASATRGRVLVRASGTEPLVRVMVEAETEDDGRAATPTRSPRSSRSVLGA